MIKLEIKKNLTTISFIISVLLLYIIFLLGDSGHVLPDNTTTTILGAIGNKMQGNWQRSSDSSFLVRMYTMWNDNAYLTILMPFICALPGVLKYLEEKETGNKKMILVRSSLREYYISKIIGNAVCAVSVSIAAVILYYTTLLIFFDNITLDEEAFPVIYYIFSEHMVENTDDISIVLIAVKLFKGIFYFCIYSIMAGSFCLWMAVLLKDKYTTFGSTIFLSYLQCRIVEELSRKYIIDGVASAGVLSDILNPVFLHFAGNSGFYQDKEWQAVLLAVCIILFNYFMFIQLSGKQFDISER